MDRSKLHKYKRGSILRIHLTNFMIYENITFTPGPFLNLILGPNGSGKSAFVCSIIMGCGGDPAVTGRSSSLIDYIRYGSQTASIVIEFYSGDVNEENIIIERQLRSVQKNGKTECQSSWKLNGRTAQRKDVLDFITSLHVEINNLCQVLPQERVVEFSKLSPKELLVSTEKSIGDSNLYSNHMRLITLSNEAADLAVKIKNCHGFIMKFNNHKTTIEPDMKLLKQRKKFEREIGWLEKKKIYLQFQAKHEQYEEIRKTFYQKKKEFETATNRLKPVKKRIENCIALSGKLHSRKSKSAAFMKLSSDKVSKCTKIISDIDRAIAKEIDDYNEIENNKKKNKEKLAKLEINKRNFESELQMADDDTQESHFEEKLKEIDEEIRKIEWELQQVETKTDGQKHRLGQLQHEKERCERQKRQLGDLFNLRLQKIVHHEKDNSTQKACQWLENNADAFSGAVYPPVITHINVSRPEYVKYVEMAIGGIDLSTFLFENREDLQLFCEKLEADCQVRVNVAMLPRDMTIEDCARDFSLDRYRQFGIFASVRDLFTAPDPVMIYLCKSYHLHRIPVGNHETENQIQELMDHSDFRRIFTSQSMYIIVVSRYDNAKTTKINALRQERFLNVIINQEEMDQVNSKLSEFAKEMHFLENQIEEDKLKIEKITETRRMKRDVRSTFENRKTAIELMKRRLESVVAQIEDTKQRLSEMDDSKGQVTAKLDSFHKQQMKTMAELSDIVKACVEHTKAEAVFTAKINFIKKVRATYTSQKAELEEETKYLQSQLLELSAEVKKVRDAVKKANEEVTAACGADVTDPVKGPDILEKFATLPNDEEEIENVESVLRLRCQGIANIDESILEEYQKYQRDIAIKNEELAKLEADAANVEKEIQTIRPRWVNALKELIGKIDNNFGEFMQTMQYSGEVYLYEGEKEYAFEDYGIRIKVKFRDAELMKDLDAFHQSGGERSVSTMVYMLSLQELANVPFRVVDEINQGMDDRNERLVFDLISTVSQRNSSQYFLLSPKLLPRLKFSGEMTVNIIINSPYVFTDLSRKTIQRLAKRPPLNASTVSADVSDGSEVDEGMDEGEGEEEESEGEAEESETEEEEEEEE